MKRKIVVSASSLVFVLSISWSSSLQGTQTCPDGTTGDDVIQCLVSLPDPSNGDQNLEADIGADNITVPANILVNHVYGDGAADTNPGQPRGTRSDPDQITIYGDVQGNVVGDYAVGDGAVDTIYVNARVIGDVIGDDVDGQGGDDEIAIIIGSGSVYGDWATSGGDDLIIVFNNAIIEGDVYGDAVLNNAGEDEITIAGIVQGNVYGDGARPGASSVGLGAYDYIAISSTGVVQGSVSGGAGDDWIRIMENSSVGGFISGDEGYDSLDFLLTNPTEAERNLLRNANLPNGQITLRGQTYDWNGIEVILLNNTLINPEPSPLDPPTNLTAQLVANEIVDLNWVDADGESSLLVERTENGRDWTQIAELPVNERSYRDQTVTCGVITYAYRVRAYRSLDNTFSPYSNEASVTTNVCGNGPQTITLLGPANNASVDAGDIVFSWQTDSIATAYELQIAQDNQTIHLQSYNEAATCVEGVCTVTVNSLAAGTYTWAVRGHVNGVSYGPWGIPRTFIATLPATGQPVLIAPINDLTLNVPYVTFTWQPVPGVEWYHIGVSRAGVAAWQQWMENTDGLCDETMCSLQLPITQDGAYQWAIQGWNEVSGIGPWSEIGSFSMQIPVPAQPVLISPATASTVEFTSSVEFVWQDDPAVSWYRLRYTVTSDGLLETVWVERTHCNDAECRYTVNDLIGPRYSWWVAGWNQANGLGPESDRNLFVLDTPAAGPVVVRSPGGGSTWEVRDMTFRWRPDNEATWYNVRVERSLTRETIYRQWHNEADLNCDIHPGCSLTVPNLTSDDYAVFIWGWDGTTGPVPTPSPTYFTIEAPLPHSIEQLTPMGDSTVSGPQVRFSWHIDPAVTWYQVAVLGFGEDTPIHLQWHEASESNCSTTSPTCEVMLNLPQTDTYSWWIRGWSQSSGLTPWSDGVEFDLRILSFNQGE